MKPKKAGDTPPRRSLAGGESGGGVFARVGDEGRQAGGGAEPRKSCADGRNGLDARIVVQQRAAAAIDLQVDEPWREDAAAQRHALGIGRRVSSDDTLDAAAIDDQRRAIPPQLAIEDAGAGVGDAAHTVSVTFLRCGGWSGSCPR